MASDRDGSDLVILKRARSPAQGMKYVEGAEKLFLNTGTKFPREIIWSVSLIKSVSARTNHTLKKLDEESFTAITRASQEVMDGRHDDRVTVDVFQTGSGTGINMNINELIAELASADSKTKIHPNDQVNMGQSSNDVVPTAIRVAAVWLAQKRLIPSINSAIRGLEDLGNRNAHVHKSGRTHLRDALPVTLGQEFRAYADALEHDRTLIRTALTYCRELPIGGTAVGTGINTHPEFGKLVVRELNAVTGLGFTEARNRFRAMRLLTDMVALSASLRVTALDLHRLCQDIRLMFSGPLTGLGEVDIPSQEEVAGSSIMPGKTNPVTVEATLLACSQVTGLDAANQMAGTLGEFELSMGVPLIGYNINLQIKLLSEALSKVAKLVLSSITPDKERLRTYAETSPSLITVISPAVGYDKAAKIGKKLTRGHSIRDELRELGYSEKEIDKMLDLRKLAGTP